MWQQVNSCQLFWSVLLGFEGWTRSSLGSEETSGGMTIRSPVSGNRKDPLGLCFCLNLMTFCRGLFPTSESDHFLPLVRSPGHLMASEGGFPSDTQSHRDHLRILTVVPKAAQDVSTEKNVTVNYSKASAEWPGNVKGPWHKENLGDAVSRQEQFIQPLVECLQWLKTFGPKAMKEVDQDISGDSEYVRTVWSVMVAQELP